jgi:outer membrane protein assembly factor BamB
VIAGSDLRSAGAAAYLYAFDRETGAVRWKTGVGAGVMTDLPVFDRLLFGVTLGDELIALDRETGERVWSFASGATNESFWMSSSPAVLGERVFFGGLNGVLYALNARTGQLVWKRELGSRISTGLVANEVGVYAGTSDGRLHLVNRETGEVEARIETESAPRGRLVLAGGRLLAFLGENALACYPGTLARPLWIRVGDKPWTSSRPYAWGELALAGNELGEVFAFRLADGAIVWTETIGGTIRGIGAADDGLYVGILTGEVRARAWPRRISPPATP